MQSKGHTSLDKWRKGQPFEDVCKLLAWKFFIQAQQQGHYQAEELLPTHVVGCLMPISDPVLMSLICRRLDQLPEGSATCLEMISYPKTTFDAPCHLLLRLASFKPANGFPSQGII
ncbi:hypothetical protein TNCV_1601111 [Trichonephila clavipes]|nr:hypothetical protein TNCV_1601111 [Trichonephila clavipes]